MILALSPASNDDANVNTSAAGAPQDRSTPGQEHSRADQGLPHTVQVGEVKRGQQLTEGSVADPAEESKSPPEAREEPQLKHTHIVTPAREKERTSGRVSSEGFAGYLPWVFKVSHLLQLRDTGLILKTAS